MTTAQQTSIHPTAIIGPEVEIGTGTEIGPYVIIEGQVEIGRNNKILSHTVIEGPTRIGDGNRIGPHAAIGTPAEMVGGEYRFGVELGDGNWMREFATVQSGVEVVTRVGNECYLMNKSHVGHDVQVGNLVRVAPCVVLGGHSILGDRVFMGMGSVIHQRLRVGEGAMIGMNATITRDVKPWRLVMGSPGRAVKFNIVGLERAGLTLEDIDSDEL